jgi:hypothetical protein
MITNFEDLTGELSDEEIKLVPILIKGFKKRTIDNPIKDPEIRTSINATLDKLGLKKKLSSVRLRKLVHYIRTESLIPLIATSKGYYVSYDEEVIKGQIKSLEQRARSIQEASNGLQAFINRNLEE